MSAVKDGGQAFPRPAVYSPFEILEAVDGMTLRDWFAGQAAAAMIGGLVSAKISTDAKGAMVVAQSAYLLADAMIAERDKAGEGVAV